MAEWVITCNTHQYNVSGAFAELKKIDWKQSTNVEVCDTIYIYVCAPMGAIKYKCKVNKVNLSDEEADIDDSIFVLDGSNYESYGRYMELELMKEYPNTVLMYEDLIKHGLKTIQGPSHVTEELHSFIDNISNKLDKKQSREQIITILMEAFGRSVTARELTNIIYPNNKNQSNVNAELNYMIQQGKVKRTGTAQQFYYELTDNKMRRYFYVFQNQGFSEEVAGEYLWEPNKEKDNSNNHHWSKMNEVKKGDVILHVYKKYVAAVSIVKAECYSSQRPIELPYECNNVGWRVDSDYYIFENAIKPIDLWKKTKVVQPVKYALFVKNGSDDIGYLYNANKEMTQLVLEATANAGAPVELKWTTTTDVNNYNDAEMESLMVNQDVLVIDNLVKQFTNNMPEYIKEEEMLEDLRKKFVADYCIQKLTNMKKEDYVVGLGRHDTFCYRLETELMDLGDIHGSTSVKFGLYYGKSGEDKEEKYRTAKGKFGENPDKALEEIKKQIVFLLIDGQKKNYEAIRKCTLATIFRGKILATFFPDDYLCIFSDEHLVYFLKKLDIDYSAYDDTLDKQQKLMDWKKNHDVMKNWNTHLFSKFLYMSFGRPFEMDKEARNLQAVRDKSYPRDYVSKVGITIDKWKSMLQNPEVFTKYDINLIKRIYMENNHAATCYDFGIKDGVSPSSYIKPVIALSIRISEAVGLPPIYGNDGKQTWWRIPFWGSYREDGHFEWKVRPKLAKAIIALWPELDLMEANETEDDELVDELKQANLKNAQDDFQYNGTAKKKQAPKYTNGNMTYPRNRQTALNALAHAHYGCEVEVDHPSFIRKKSDKNYTEPHHLVPMAFSDSFEVSLDVEENIISLCSNCHNQIHYGRDAEELLRKLYESRKDDLKRVGIDTTIEQLLKMYGIY